MADRLQPKLSSFFAAKPSPEVPASATTPPSDEPAASPAAATAPMAFAPAPTTTASRASKYGRAIGKPMCPHGVKCYRKNPAHFVEQDHPADHPYFDTPITAAQPQPPAPSPLPQMQPAKKRPLDDASAVASAGPSSSTDPASASEAASNAKAGVAPPFTGAGGQEERAAWHARLSSTFFTSFGDDMFALFEVARRENSKAPSLAFSSAGVTLLAPFRLLSGELRLADATPCTDRGLYDPPEFQPLLRISEAGRSESVSATDIQPLGVATIGYWRDDPADPPTLLAILKSNTAKQGPGACITPLDEPHLVTALHAQLKTASSAASVRAQACGRVASLLLHAAAEFGAPPLDSGIKAGAAMAARRKSWVAPTSHKMGIVVPYDKDTEVGYRALDPKGAELRKLLDRLERSTGEAKASALQELDSLLNWATIANDESDFGASLQLGADIFNHAPCFANLASRTLGTAYRLLGRDAFADIAEMHAAIRKPK